MKYSISTLVISFLLCALTAQSFEWVHEPFIEGYDTVEIKRQNLDFITVTKNGKIGVVNLNGKLIVPVEFRSFVNIWEDWILLGHDNGSSYYDKNGKHLDDIKDVAPLSKEIRKRGIAEKANTILKELQNLWPGIKTINPGSKDGFWPLIKPSGDTILLVTNLDRCQVIGDKFFYYTKNLRDTYILVDRNLNDIVESTGKSVQVYNNGHIKVNRHIVDNTGELHLRGYDWLRFDQNAKKYLAKRNDSTFIFNENFTPFLNESFSRVETEYIGEDIYFTLFSEDEMSFLNLTTGFRDRHPHHFKRFPGKERAIRSFKIDSLTGLYDVVKRKVILEPQYKHIIRRSEDVYIAANEPFRNGQNKIFKRSVFNSNGEKVFEANVKSVTPVRDLRRKETLYIQVRLTDTTSILFDTAFNKILEYHLKDNLYFSSGWATEFVNKSRRCHLISDYLAGRRNDYYESNPEIIPPKLNYIPFIKVKRNGKIGFCNLEGELIYPCELDDATGLNDYGGNYGGYFMAKKDGKWGVMRRPTEE